MQPKVSELVAKINWITSQSSFPDVSKLEFDLVMQYVRDLYDELHSLRNPGNAQNKEAKVSEPVREVVHTAVITKPVEEKILPSTVTAKTENRTEREEP